MENSTLHNYTGRLTAVTGVQSYGSPQSPAHRHTLIAPDAALRRTRTTTYCRSAARTARRGPCCTSGAAGANGATGAIAAGVKGGGRRKRRSQRSRRRLRKRCSGCRRTGASAVHGAPVHRRNGATVRCSAHCPHTQPNKCLDRIYTYLVLYLHLFFCLYTHAHVYIEYYVASYTYTHICTYVVYVNDS